MTFTGRWQPRHGQKSLGLDWATIADSADQAGAVLGLACRDWYALLGASWHGSMMLPGRRLAWPIWQRPLSWQALLHLTARPELAAAADQDYRKAQWARRQLRQWTVTRLLIATAARRTMHAKSSYELWTDADDIDVRALQ